MECFRDPPESGQGGYRILICVENELARRGLTDMLRSLSSVAEVHYCPKPSPDAISCIPPFDILILSCEDFSDAGAFVVTDEAARRGAKVLLLLGRHVESSLDAVTRLPGDGFLIQEEVTAETLGRVLGLIPVGAVPMPAALVSRLLERAGGEVLRPRTEAVRLTPREREALNLVVEGLSNKQIARRMLISQHGVKRLVANVLAKLNCANRTLAATVAVKQGLLEGEPVRSAT